MENKIEQEIADLTRQIEAKRKILESQKGIIEEREVVRQAVAEKITESVPTFSPANKPVSSKSNNSPSYLDSVDEETTEIVNGLLATVFSKGIDAAVKEAENQNAYVMDAFHDALTDKLYEQLKSQGITN